MPTADLQVNDNGTLTITVTADDADGVATAWPSGAPAPTVTASDATPGPTSFVIGAAVATATGFTFPVSVVQPPPQPLATGVTFAVTAASGFQGQTAPITVTTQAVDVVAGPASSFVATLSEP